MSRAEFLENYVTSPESLPEVFVEDILLTLSYLQIPWDEYFIIGGANLVLREIKTDTPDIDMLVSEEVFEWLSTIEGAEIKEPPPRAIENGANNKSVWLKNSYMRAPISATRKLGDGLYPMSFESHKDKVESVMGIPCAEINQVIDAKVAIQRRKDLYDLRLISETLGYNILPGIELVMPDSEGR